VHVLDQIVASVRPYRANRALAALKKLTNWALDRGMIEVNPIAGLKPPHRERARDLVLSDEELLSLMRAAEAEGYPFGNALKMLILTGQRRGEVAGMRWSEIDLERAVWTIPAARSKNGRSHEVQALNVIEPSCQIVQHFSSHLGILAAGSCWHVKRMIRIPEKLEGCALTKSFDQRLYECSVGERIAGSLQEQHRDFDLEQMISTLVRGAPSGMKGKAEKHQASDSGQR
jgi:hypothetical protein